MSEITQAQRIETFLKKRHPAHTLNSAEWCFLRKAIEGGHTYVEGNLWKYPKEEEVVFEARKKRAGDHHFNVSMLVISAYIGYLFAKEPTKAEKLPQQVLDFMANADGEGNDIYALAEEIATWQMGYGIVWVGVDKPAFEVDPTNPLTEAEEEERGLKPYAYITHPTHVLDGKLVKGKPVWLLVKEDYRDDEGPFDSGEARHRFRLWERTQWTLFTPDPKHPTDFNKMTITNGSNAIGEVPFVPFRYGKGSGFSMPGLIADIAHIDRAIFNKASQLDEIHYAATFPQLRYPYEGDILRETFDDDGNRSGVERTAEGEAILTVSLHSVIPYRVSGDNKAAPDYMSPSVEPAKELDRSIDRMVARALSQAFLDGEFGTPGEEQGGKAAASGVSKSYVFEKLNKRISAIAGRLEDGLQRVFELVLRWHGISPEQATELPQVLDWPDSYEVRSLAQLIADDIALGGLGIGSKTFAALVAKETVRRRMPKLEDKLVKQIDTEIDANQEALDVARTAMINGEVTEDEDEEKDDDDKTT